MLRGKSLLFTIILTLLLISLLAACAAPAKTTQPLTTSAPATTIQTSTSKAPPSPATSPMASTTAAVKPQGELVAALQSFGNENWFPWLDPVMSNLHDLVYDMLIYWDHINRKFFPGLAESWEVSPDGLITTFHLRKGIQYMEGWGELTSADVKYNFEMQASKLSIGKTAQTRRITSMDTPDPYTLVVHFKDPYPTFFVDMAMANSGVCQGIVCKKYVETVGEDVASQKPIGTGPYKLVDFQSGSFFKLEALDSHWRVVPEFKILTVRLLPEASTYVAALKNKEIDLSQVPGDQMADLQASGIAVEVSAIGGNLMLTRWGGMIISADKRYDPAYHNKDPWTDIRVRKAMAIAIDREALCKAIYHGYAEPIGVPFVTADTGKYQYPYDPVAAKQLLKEAGYPNGFSFKTVSYTVIGAPETPRLVEALAGYWQQIGLDPKITSIDYNTYNRNNINSTKTAGDISLGAFSPVADTLSRGEIYLMPNAVTPLFEDEGSYAIYQEMPKVATFEARAVCADKLNQYYYDKIGPIPLIRAGFCFAWNSDKIVPWPHHEAPYPVYLEYVRHAQPLNTFRLFSPWPDR